MALTLTQTIGSEVVTEKLVFRLVQGLPIQFPETQMELIVNDASNTFILQHLPVLGTNDTFDFEVNSILKDYFSGEFLPLSGANQTAIDNALVFLLFKQVDTSGVVGAATTPITLTVKNITQDTFEIEDFDLTDYDCGDAGNITSKLLTSSPSPLPIGDLTSIHVSCLTTSYTGGVTPKQEWLIQTLLNGVFVSTINEAVTVPDRGISGYITPAKFDISTYRFDFDSSTGIDEVRFYIRDIASPFTIRSETKIYKLREDCEKTMTLSWFNELGAQDSYTFAGNINRVGKYTDSTFKRVRPVAPLSTDVGDLVYKSSYNYEYDLFSDRIPEKHVEWLSKMLINKRAAIQSNTTPITYNGLVTVNQLTSPIVGANQYGLPIDGNNGFMYVAPFVAGDILKINISTGVITSFGALAVGLPKWFGAERAPNGKIYCIPFYDDDVLVIDPSNDTTSTLALPTSIGNFVKWKSSAITSGGVIYSAPFGNDCDTVLKIDTNTDTVTEFGSVLPKIPVSPATGNKYQSVVLASSGIVYCFNVGGEAFLKIDTSNDVITSFGNQGINNVTPSRSFELGNYIYAFGNTNLIKIRVSTDAVSTISNASIGLSSGTWVDSVLAPDGNFYFPPNTGDDLQIYNTSTGQASVVQTIETAPEWYAMGISITGIMYGVPNKTNEALKITLGSDPSVAGKYFPIVITTDESTLEDKFSPETLFRIKFRLANRRKGIK